MNNTMRFYDLIAEKEAEEWYPNNLLLPAIKEYINLFSIKPRILDLGCGTGHESMRFKKEGIDIVGIDFSKESIRIAKERNKNIEFYLLDFFEIHNSLGMFDGIFSSGSMIHLNEVKLVDLLHELYKIQNNNGLFSILFQNGEGQRIHYPEINGEKIERIVERYSKEKMIELFNLANYTFVKEIEISESAKNIWINLVFRK